LTGKRGREAAYYHEVQPSRWAFFCFPLTGPANNKEESVMKLRFLVSIALAAMPLSLAGAQISVEITEVPYTKPYAFLGLHFETGGSQTVIRASDSKELIAPQTGFGLRMQSARPENVQLEFEVGYRRLDMTAFKAQNIGLGTFDIGGRFYPRYPTFGLGNSIGVRLTASALGGYAFDFADSTVSGSGDSGIIGGFDMRFSAGLAFSGRTDPSGITTEIVYRPSQLTGARYSLKPSWALRFGFLFGPT
jgi:hypothetical protein